jgi:GntR family transcriptional regulator
MAADHPTTETHKLHPYQRLQNDLAELIAQTAPGNRLPAEPELARRLGVSRATLREAMRSFEGQGRIRRRQGVGTFVVGQTNVIESGLEKLESIETLASRFGLEVGMGAERIESVPAGDDLAEKLNIPAESQVTRVNRVILAGNRPVAYLIDQLPADVLQPADLAEGFTGSVLDWLLRRGEPMLGQSSTEIRAVAASTEVARALEIQRGDVLLEFIGLLYSADGRMLDYSFSYFLPGTFTFHVLRRVGDSSEHNKR